MPKAFRPAIFTATILTLTAAAPAQEEGGGGRVEIPVEVYNALVEASRHPTLPPRAAPAPYALGRATVTVTVGSSEPRATAEVRVELAVDVFDDDWVLVPVLPAATPVESASVNGSPVQLLAAPEGLAWSVKSRGSYTVSLAYRVDAIRSGGGFSVAIPLPRAAAINLSATLPGTNLDVTLIPAAGVEIRASGQTTRVRATVPTSDGVQLVWRTPAEEGHAVSRATYTGELAGEAVAWSAELDVELFTDETFLLRLLPRSATLNGVQVDGEATAILVEDGFFVTPIKGRGGHRVGLGFLTPVRRDQGPPRVDLQIPAVPVSRFDLTLPGRKEVSVNPAANVTHRPRDAATVATVFTPMTERVSFSWAEAVPEEVGTEVRANAAFFHTVWAEEGVLNVRAFARFEITRGEASSFELDVPEGVQVNRITSPLGAVADWRVAAASTDAPRRATVFLDRQVDDELTLEVHYDRSLASRGETSPLPVPLLGAPEAHRQRGMVALLSSRDFTLRPVAEGEATRVGENQLPAFVRDALTLPVAHTFKYVETPPALTVEPEPPERQLGRYDAQVDTLISLGEVSLQGSVTVEIHVKSGTTMGLRLTAPAGVNILNLTGPSLRTYDVERDGGPQVVDVQFTQEMEGQFRLEASYELIVDAGGAELVVPTLAVEGAEVEQGRIAVEALSAVEVQTISTERLSALDVSELPQQLILRTTNPILLAYKYVRTDPPHELRLKVTRHQLLDVQEAAIDRAGYRTLYTRDGLAVTAASFQVRNSRKQFLRLQLPADSEVWSAFVDGRAEKPAIAQEDGGRQNVLLKIVNSTRGFPVELIYATRGSKVRGLGKVEGALPHPDILVTETRWDVYLPADVSYGEPATNLDVAVSGRATAAEELAEELARLQPSDGGAQVVEPLRIVVPVAGIHFAFEKLYANQGDESAWFTLPYASGAGAALGRAIAAVSALAGWLGIALLWGWPLRRPRAGWALLGTGALGLVLTVGFYGVSLGPPLVATLAVAIAAALRWAWHRRQQASEAEG